MKKVKIKSMLVAVACTICMSAFAAEATYPVPAGQSQVGRYLTVSNAKPTNTGLAQIVQVKMPDSVQNIGEAITYALQGTGYQLLSYDDSDAQIQNLLSLPLPNQDRNLNPMSLEDLLSTLSGSEYQIIVDQVNKLITFKLTPALAPFYDTAK